MIAKVIVDSSNNRIDKMFDYEIPNDISVKVGDRILVPFGNQKIEAYCVEIAQNSEFEKIKSVIKLIDSLLNEEQLKTIDFLVKKYNLRKIDAIRLFLPVGLRNNKIKEITKSTLILTKNEFNFNKNAKKQEELYQFLKKNNQIDKIIANKEFGQSAVKGLLSKKIVEEKTENFSRRPYENFVFEKLKTHILNSMQQNAKEVIENSQGKAVLLHGITGSGKTEVYMQCIEDVIKNNKTALMLVPEIGLTPMMFKNFYGRFGDKIAIIHSGLSMGERFDEWQRIFKGEAKIVIGARSAIFAPIKNLGIVIIDEEHDSSYVSETNPRYNAIEVAKFRCEQNNAILVLGSATPSVESYYKALNNEYILVEMPKRVNDYDLPTFEIVDMCGEQKEGNLTLFSRQLLKNLSEVIEKKEQAMLFLNRRGYSSFLMCTNCGYTAKCEDCDVSLVYHKEDNRLKCHYCGKQYKVMDICPNCKSKFIREGYVGTEKVVNELKKIFPNVPIFRMDNDTSANKNMQINILSDFENAKPSILVGTQMIAKGHDFPFVTVVGILDADQTLHFSDFRANERSFELITQVAGRAGRSNLKGKVILQTYSPKHFVFRFASNYQYNQFFDKEINLRQTTKFPPYSTILRILFTSENEDCLREHMEKYYQQIKQLREQNKIEFLYLSVMKCPLKRKQKKYRYQILMRLKNDNEKLIEKIYEIDKSFYNKNVITFVEINPNNLS